MFGGKRIKGGGLQRSGEGTARRESTRHEGRREFTRRNEQKKKKKTKNHSGPLGAGARTCTGTYSVVDGDERSVATLPCLLSCCSLGEDGSESLISSVSSWADWDLVFFLLNACLKELRSCKAEGGGGGTNKQTNK